MEEPTVRARWMVTRKRRFYSVGALMLIGALAAVGWGAMTANLVWFMVGAIVLMLGGMLVLLPYMVERQVNEFDSGSNGAATRRILRTVVLLSSLLVVASSIFGLAGAEPGSALTPLWWVLLVVSATLAVVTTAQLLRKGPDKYSPHE